VKVISLGLRPLSTWEESTCQAKDRAHVVGIPRIHNL
jgi:hypothetical protein